MGFKQELLSSYELKPQSFRCPRTRQHLFFEEVQPQPDVKKIHLIFFHGALEYHGRHLPLFEGLLSAFKGEIKLSYMDLPGHGLSGGARSSLPPFEELKSLVGMFLDKVFDSDFEKTFLMGHSLGGLLGLSLLLSERGSVFSGGLFSNPCLKVRLPLPKMESTLSRLPTFLNKVRLPLFHGGDELTSDKKRAESFDHDPLISRFIGIEMGREILNLSRKVRTQGPFLKSECLFLLSGNDVIVESEATDVFIRGVDKKLIEKHFYPEARHDLLNERNRDDVFKHIKKWIEERF